MSTGLYNKMTEAKRPIKKVDADEETMAIRDLLNRGAVEMSSMDHARQFFMNGGVYNEYGGLKFSFDALATHYAARVIAGRGDILDPRYDFVTSGQTYIKETRTIKMTEKSKNREIRVLVDESGEIIQGKKELDDLNLLGVRKLNKKEESIINVRELADFYVMEEINRSYVKFDMVHDKFKYDELYKKHYKNIISCRSEN